MTTQDKIKKFMNVHPMHTVFILEGLRYYVTELLKNEEQVKKDMSSGFINAEDWISIAKEAEKELLN